MTHKIKVNTQKCIGCSACIKDCPQKNIFLDENKKAVIKSQDCIKCGHCSAICPKNAISLSGYSQEPIEIEGLQKVDSKKLMNSIITRRSIRQFKDKKIEKEKLDMIIEAGRYTPTGKNSQNVSYIVIDKDKRKLEDIAVRVFKKLVTILGIFKKTFRGFEIDDNFFFKKAPIVIAVVSDNQVDGSLAAANMALMAESLELGVLYSGFFSFAVKISRKLKKSLNLKKNQKVITTLVIGYPNVKYKRTTQKEDAKVIYR